MLEDLETVSYPFAVFLVAKNVIPRYVRPKGEGDPRPDYVFLANDVQANKPAFRRVENLLKINPNVVPARSIPHVRSTDPR